MLDMAVIASTVPLLFIIVWICGTDGVYGEGEVPRYKDVSMLVERLLKDYNYIAPPNTNNTGTDVNIGLSLTDIESLDEVNSILTTHVWIRLSWIDPRLQFDPSDYGNLTRIAVPMKYIWRPDIIPYNLAQAKFEFSSHYQAVVSSSGLVAFVPHTRLQTRCVLDLTKYPFDQQECSIRLLSWVYHSGVVNLKPTGVGTRHFKSDSNWVLVNSTYRLNSRFYSCCPDAFQDFQVNITFRRHSGLLAHMFLGPAAAIGLVIPVIFLLPEQSIYKLVMGGSLLISQVLVLSNFVQALPISHKTMPALGRYQLVNVVLILIAMVLSTLVIHCSEKAKNCKNGVPTVINKIFLGVFGHLFCTNREDFIETTEAGSNAINSSPEFNSPTNDTDDSATMVKDYTRLVAPAEWRQLAVVLDRLFFSCFAIFTVIIMASMVRLTGTA